MHVLPGQTTLTLVTSLWKTTLLAFGMHSPAIGSAEYGAMFHGIDERVDIETLRLSTEMWMALAHDFLV